jgi:hypothetical protein
MPKPSDVSAQDRACYRGRQFVRDRDDCRDDRERCAATLEVPVPTATSLIEIDIPNRSFRSLPQHVRGTAQTR